jgi:Glycosyl transferase family 2
MYLRSMKLPISVCMIVRDEAENLSRALASVAPHVQELVVVDTGSQDASREIAKSFGAVQGEHPWDEDFAAARNTSLSLATQEWILVLDADEELLPESVNSLAKAIEAPGLARILRVRLLNEQGGRDVPLVRLYRNDPQIRYIRPIHESITETLWDAGETEPSFCDAVIVHHGYQDAATSRAKIERNLRIHRRMRASGKVDAFDLYKHAQILLDPSLAQERQEVLDQARALLISSPTELRSQWPWAGKLRALCARQDMACGNMGKAREILTLEDREIPTIEHLQTRLDWAWNTGNFDRAESDRRLLGNLGAGPEALMSQTRQAQAQDDFATLERIAASGSIEAAAWLGLGMVQSGEVARGMTALGKPMSIAGHDPVVRLASGICLARLGDPASAKTLLASVNGFCTPMARAWLLALRFKAGEELSGLLQELNSLEHWLVASLAVALEIRASEHEADDFEETLMNKSVRRWKEWLA